MPPQAEKKHYFVDEAGDLTLFNRRKQVTLGREGMSHCFMVGVIDLPDPAGAQQQLEELRRELLADPYFRGVPSMQPAARKTAVVFHAKDDPPEVRREVFKLLPWLGAKAIIAIRRKERLAAEARAVFAATGRRLSADQVYDGLVARLFRDRLHVAESNEIVFARRGKSDRNEALGRALDSARRSFERKWRKEVTSSTTITCAYPSAFAGLQVADYYLWAIQRMFERSEERYVQLLDPQFGLVMDLDDTRRKPYGEWYSRTNPLRLDKIKPVTSG